MIHGRPNPSTTNSSVKDAGIVRGEKDLFLLTQKSVAADGGDGGRGDDDAREERKKGLYGCQ